MIVLTLSCDIVRFVVTPVIKLTYTRDVAEERKFRAVYAKLYSVFGYGLVLRIFRSTHLVCLGLVERCVRRS